MTGDRTIDGEVVSSRAISDRPAARVALACDTHPAWMGCGQERPGCVPYMVSPEPESEGFKVVDRRRLSYPRLTAEERGRG